MGEVDFIDKKLKAPLIFMFALFILIGTGFLATYVFLVLSKTEIVATSFLPNNIVTSMITNKMHLLMYVSFLLMVVMVMVLVMNSNTSQSFASELDNITDTIKTPKRIGQSQHGSANWLSKKQIDKVFSYYELKEKNKTALAKGGLVVGYEKLKNKEKIHYLDDDVHSLILGATRCGKTRSIILQSICFIGLSGESMVITDAKGELFDYTSPFLNSLGYDVVALDFKYPMKSSKYNFLQPIINAVKEGDTPKAVSLVWDITSSLVTESKGERIWHDGEASVIAGSIMSVVFDNMDRPEFQNFTNVFNFINYMCKAGEKGEMPLNKYINSLKDEHPAKSLFGVALLAPSKTRGSFFTSALATLRLFTNPYIYNMSCETEFSLEETGTKKRAVFIILPDEKTTYHGLASLFVYQFYIALVEKADSLGGRLERRVNMLMDEFGNFSKIPAFTNMLTVGGGRGIRFNIVIQSFSQIEEKYGRETAETVKDNCHCLIYLRSENPNTNAEISKRLGKYTTSSYGRSNSNSSKSPNSSSSMNLIGRELLMPDEVNKIQRPYLLVMYSGCHPAIMQMPDISKWYFNKMLGMGDKNHNTKLRLNRQNARQSRDCKPFKLWGIWHKYKVGGIQDPTEFPEVDVKNTIDEDDAIKNLADDLSRTNNINMFD